MPKITIGTTGFDLVFTAKLPPTAMALLKQHSAQEVAAFGLTPSWGSVPSLNVADLRRSGIKLPEHWGDFNTVYPIVYGMSFYIVPTIPNGCAVSFAMNGVNLRTGQREQYGTLTDQPCQSYWSTHTAWIDGYVPSHGQAVRQFVPLRDEAEMAYDVARHVGVTPDDSFKDGITMTTFLPRDVSKLQAVSYRHGYDNLESLSFGVKGVMRGGDQPKQVGMGAGALMRQRHEENPLVHATDFFSPLPILVARLVWDDQYNEWARQSGGTVLSGQVLRQLEERQRDYEAQIWHQLGGRPHQTDVDDLPKW